MSVSVQLGWGDNIYSSVTAYEPGSSAWLNVTALQASLNRYAGILRMTPLREDGIVGPKTALRAQQVAAAFLPTMLSSVFVPLAQLQANADYLAVAFGKQADAMKLTGTVADKPPPAVADEIDLKLKLAGVPRQSSFPVVAGVALLALAGIFIWRARRH